MATGGVFVYYCGMGPLRGLNAIYSELDDLEHRRRELRARAARELKRLSRNRHRKRALREVYWDTKQRLPVQQISELFGIPVKDVASRAGDLEVSSSCLLCRTKIAVSVPNRAARAELEREQGVNPRWRICVNCRAFRELDLELLRKKPGEKLTAAHRAAYAAYLRTPQWAERRARALRRAKNRCQLCSRKRALQVHHRTYVRIGQERDADLTVLCSRCHGGHHGH